MSPDNKEGLMRDAVRGREAESVEIVLASPRAQLYTQRLLVCLRKSLLVY